MTPDIAPASARKPSDVLEAAADLIEPEGAWTRRELARNATGAAVPPIDPSAICWCMAGAMQRQTGGYTSDFVRAIERLEDRSRGGIGLSTLFNDRPERTQAEVVTALRRAAALARSEGQ